MFDHISIGVADVRRARRFYDAVLEPLGYRCLSEAPDSLGYGSKAVALWVNKAKKPMKADLESGLHFCFSAPSRKAVDAFHAAGVNAGGSSNGEPGVRSDYGDDYYAAYLIDPDGYRIEAYRAGR
jgi:catechol 2,3-dioxygenase-like lactoylglutathione lyase family enzyme